MIDKYNIGGGTGMNKPARPAQSECNGLLSCPFCGGRPEQQWIPQSMSLPGITRGGFSVVCQSCFCVCLIGGRSAQDAKTHWNNRIR
jgi:hypothetical protein